jgi:hypothetical protein
MQVVRAADIVTWNDSNEGGRSVRTGRLQAAKRIAHQRRWSTVAVTTGLNSSIDTLYHQLTLRSCTFPLTVELEPHISRYASVTGLQVDVSTTFISKCVIAPFSPDSRSWRTSSPTTPVLVSVCACESVIIVDWLTVWPFSCLRIKGASSLNTVVFLSLANISTNEISWLSKASSNSELMKPSLTPLVLLPHPAALNEISLTRLNSAAFWMIKMSLAPQNLLVDVATRVSQGPGCQNGGSKSLRNMNHPEMQRQTMVWGTENALQSRHRVSLGLLYFQRLHGDIESRELNAASKKNTGILCKTVCVLAFLIRLLVIITNMVIGCVDECRVTRASA